MKIFDKKQDLKVYLSKLKAQNKSIGFVPTMGALHDGHISLVKKAQRKNDVTVVSIFVNPTQFDQEEDLLKYPKTLEKDIALLSDVHCDILFNPSVAEIYSESINAQEFDFDGLEHEMEGKFRKGHFNGVGTIVKTLFEIVEPDKAYFGQKDFQQLQIIKKMVKKHSLKVKIKGCSIFRENDGLAMSSRNSRLTSEERQEAPFIYKTLKKIKEKFNSDSIAEIEQWVTNEFSKQNLLKLEYFTIAEEKTLKTISKKDAKKKHRAFIAVFAGKIRLIDNIKLKIS